MEIALLLVAVVLVVILVSRVAAPLPLPVPLALLAAGAVLSFVPAVPEVRLSSEVVLLGLLPPLLYAAALSTSLIDIRTFRAKILSLSVGLVLFTALGVGLVAWWLLPIPFALAVALGAIVVAARCRRRHRRRPADRAPPQHHDDPRGRVAAQRRHRARHAAHRPRRDRARRPRRHDARRRAWRR